MNSSYPNTIDLRLRTLATFFSLFVDVSLSLPTSTRHATAQPAPQILKSPPAPRQPHSDHHAISPSHSTLILALPFALLPAVILLAFVLKFIYLRHRHNESTAPSRTTGKAKPFTPNHSFHSFFSSTLGDRMYSMHALLVSRSHAFFVGCLSSPELETRPTIAPKTTEHLLAVHYSTDGSSKASRDASLRLDFLHKNKTNDLELGYTVERSRYDPTLTDARTRLWNRTSTSLVNIRSEAERTGKLQRSNSSIRPRSLSRTRARTSSRSQSSLSSSQSFCLPLQYPSDIYWYPHPSATSVRLVSDARRSGISIHSTNAISSTTSVTSVAFTEAFKTTSPILDPPSRQSSQSRPLARRSQRSLSSIPEHEFKQDLSPALPPLNFGVSPPLPPSPVHYFGHRGTWNENGPRLSHVGSRDTKVKRTSINFSGLHDPSAVTNTLSLVRESRPVATQPNSGGSSPSGHLSLPHGLHPSSPLSSPRSSLTPIPSTNRPLSQNTHSFILAEPNPSKRFSAFSGDHVILSSSIPRSPPALHTSHVTFEAPAQTLGPFEAPLDHRVYSHRRRNVAEHDSGSFWDESSGAHTFPGKSDDREESIHRYVSFLLLSSTLLSLSLSALPHWRISSRPNCVLRNKR